MRSIDLHQNNVSVWRDGFVINEDEPIFSAMDKEHEGELITYSLEYFEMHGVPYESSGGRYPNNDIKIILMGNMKEFEEMKAAGYKFGGRFSPVILTPITYYQAKELLKKRLDEIHAH